jgi:antitoxin VapB
MEYALKPARFVRNTPPIWDPKRTDVVLSIAKHMLSLNRPIWGTQMKRTRTGKNKSVTSKTAARHMSAAVARRASIFRNGANQAVRLPQELRFPTDVKEVRIRKQGDGLLITPVKPNWASFFALRTEVPEDFLEDRSDSPPQPRDPL